MNDRHATLYLASRLGAAALNLLAVALFTRLATPAVYGAYLVGFATGFIVFATGCQWLLHAHFGIYTPGRAARLAGALIVTLGAGLFFGAVLLLAAIAARLVTPGAALGIGVLTLGLVLHVGAVELGRARLLVTEVALAGLLRGVLMLVLGSLALLLAQSASLLLVAIGTGQALAAMPVLLALRRGGIARPERADIAALLGYGWPLIAALAAMALALNIDRLLLEQLGGAALVGPYGAIGDVIRQSFVIVGEAVAAAYISQAKALGPDPAGRAAILRRAFITLWAMVLLGMTFWLVLGEGVLALVLDAEYAAAAEALLPLIVLGTGALALRAFYFGQAIYFAGGVRREVIATLVILAIAAVATVTLIPRFGAAGAAAAFALSQLAGLASLILADRRSGLMPVAPGPAGIVVAFCAVAGGVGLALLDLHGWWAALAPLLAVAGGLALGWDLFGLRQLLLGAMASRRQ